MDDKALVEAYFARDEQAINHTLYGERLGGLAKRLLGNDDDAEECLNDTYYKVWKSIPPHRPDSVYAFCAVICRRTAMDMLDKKTAKHRSAELVELTNELEQCIPDERASRFDEEGELSSAIKQFVEDLGEEKRAVFIRRYWFGETSSEIAKRFGISETKVRSMLFRIRKRLKKYLEGKDVGI